TDPAIGNPRGLDADQLVEQRAGDVRDRADAGMAVLQRGALLPGIGDEVLEILRRQGLAGEQDDRRFGDEAEIVEILARVVADARIKRRRRRMRAHVPERDRVAIRGRVLAARRADGAAGPADILDDDGLSELPPDAFGEDAAGDV